MNNENDSRKLITGKVKEFPKTLVMLGSGWNKVLENARIELEMGYKELFGVEAGVPGHEGKLVIAEVNEKRAAFMSGRFHMYEGYSGREATTPIRVFGELGVKKLVVTSASGGINPDYHVGDLVVLSDLITMLLPSNPLVGPKFQDMSRVFDEEWRKQAVEVCKNENIPYREGVYMYFPGPHYETPADKRAAQTLGADCVGMSTVPESIQAKWLGMKVLGLSFITNLAFVKHAHEDVVAAANAGSKRMVSLLTKII